MGRGNNRQVCVKRKTTKSLSSMNNLNQLEFFSTLFIIWRQNHWHGFIWNNKSLCKRKHICLCVLSQNTVIRAPVMTFFSYVKLFKLHFFYIYLYVIDIKIKRFPPWHLPKLLFWTGRLVFDSLHTLNLHLLLLQLGKCCQSQRVSGTALASVEGRVDIFARATVAKTFEPGFLLAIILPGKLKGK